ncbi:MAG: caspase family protein [Planctomycetota bacterium]|nr:caspase family protein [Planctomycetota bacterium]
MASDDWALIVGIRVYPGFDRDREPLRGPENDAIAFAEWVCSPVGGNVPADPYVARHITAKHGPIPNPNSGEFARGHVALILSSQFTPPAFPTPTDGQPAAGIIVRAFNRLMDLAEKEFEKNGRRRIGRRLYLFFSGHGLQPGLQQQDVAVYTADAAINRPGNHFLAPDWARHFFRAGVFDEVILFMDCCRGPVTGTTPARHPYGRANTPGNHCVFGFGSMPELNAYEKLMPDGRVHGVFSWMLLKGLAGAAAPPDSYGQITAGDLAGWMNENIDSFLTTKERKDSSIPKEFDFDFRPVDSELVLTVIPTGAPSSPVHVHLSPRRSPMTLEVRDGELKIRQQATGTTADLRLSLPMGRYFACVLEDGLQQNFEVAGTGEAVYVEL